MKSACHSVYVCVCERETERQRDRERERELFSRFFSLVSVEFYAGLEKKVEKHAYRRTTQMSLENDKRKFEAGEGVRAGT